MTALDGVTARDDKGVSLDITESKRKDALSVRMSWEGTFIDMHLSRYYAQQIRDRLDRFLETDYVKGIEGARDLFRAAKLANRMIHGTNTIDASQFFSHVLGERQTGHWLVLASDDYKAGFNAEVEKIYRELRDEQSRKAEEDKR